MRSIIMALADGDNDLPAQFADAVTAWRDFYARNKTLSEKELAQKLGQEQFRHEMHFEGDRHLGKMSMPLAALAAAYDDSEGFGDRRDYAIRLANAFKASSVSMEVKGSALVDAIVAFDLEDAPDLQEFVRGRLSL